MIRIAPLESSFKNLLDGDNAFYKKPDYLDALEEDLYSPTTLPLSYLYNTEHKIIRIAKKILSIIIFPIFIYQSLQTFAGRVALLPASNPANYPPHYADRLRQFALNDRTWKYKRFTIEVDGCKIDAMIMGKASTLGNGRWVLNANGNGEFYEEKFYTDGFKNILSKVEGNAIIFNYPGVGASTGVPNKEAMAKVYRAMLNFLEDKNRGIGAKEIIGYGHSIGGGVQGDALKTHQLKKEVNYVFVKSRSFSDLSTTASILTSKPLGFLVKLLRWNLSSTESSKALKAPEIILQTANVDDYEELTESSKVIGDGVIPAEASLAKALLEDPTCPKTHKVFFGIPETHNDQIEDPTFLTDKIKELLKTRNQFHRG